MCTAEVCVISWEVFALLVKKKPPLSLRKLNYAANLVSQLHGICASELEKTES